MNYGNRSIVVPLKNIPPSQYIDWIKPHFSTNDFALTLTFRPFAEQYSAKYNPEARLQMYGDCINNYINVVNYGFYKHDRKNYKLNCATVFELNYSQGVHAHMILERPPTKWNTHYYSEKWLLDKWVNMKCSGYEIANKVKKVYDVDGWASYMFKSATYKNQLWFDVENWHLADKSTKYN